MSKKIIKSLIMMIMMVATLILLSTISQAASLSISTSKSSVSPGEVFTVTVTLNGGAGTISASAKNGSGSGSDWLDNSSLSFSCTAGSSGVVTISASGAVADYVTEEDENVSASKSVSIVAPVQEPPTTQQPSSGTTPSGSSGSSNSGSNNKPTTTTTKPSNSSSSTNEITKSSNSKLAGLAIAEGVISPEFNSDTKEYTISVTNEMNKLNISATPEDSRATVTITGNEELQIGENHIEITVKAEDGSTSVYKILAIRNQPELGLQTLTVSYVDENGEKVTLALTPEFVGNVYEYNIEEIIPNIVENLQIEAISNKENAVIEVIGNEKLETGRNEITIKVTLTNEEGLEEQKTYKIILDKEEEDVVVPLTTMQKITKWFTGIGATLKQWGMANYNKIIVGMLAVATTALAGLTIYFIHDYRNYQYLLSKLAEFNKENLMERANGALGIEKNNISNQEDEVKEAANTYMEERDAVRSSIAERWNEFLDVPEDEGRTKRGKGKRFK